MSIFNHEYESKGKFEGLGYVGKVKKYPTLMKCEVHNYTYLKKCRICQADKIIAHQNSKKI